MTQKIKLHIPKNLFVLYLNSITKITSSIIIKIKNYTMEVLTAGDSEAILILATLKLPEIPDNDVTLELPINDISKLQKICKFAEEDELILEIENNVVKYKNENIKLKFYLAEKTIISVPQQVTAEKFNQFPISFSTIVDKATLDKIDRGFDFVKSASGDIKNYFYIEDNKFFGELTDKSTASTDSFKVALSDNYSGYINNRIAVKHDVWMTMTLSKGDVKIEASTVQRKGRSHDIMFVRQSFNDELTYSYLIKPLSGNS